MINANTPEGIALAVAFESKAPSFEQFRTEVASEIASKGLSINSEALDDLCFDVSYLTQEVA